MMKGAVHNVLEAVGGTPIVKLNHVGSHVAADIYVKLEYLNPGGSMKDRVGINIIRDYERRALLKPGGTIVEATSGNTGMGLALVAAIRGYKCIFVMPDKMSEEKIKALQAFGARVVVCPTHVEPEDPRSYYSVSRRLAEETPEQFLPISITTRPIRRPIIFRPAPKSGRRPPESWMRSLPAWAPVEQFPAAAASSRKRIPRSRLWA